MPVGPGPHPGKGSPAVPGAAGPPPLRPLQPGIQLQAWQHWGLGEDLAKPEEERAPGQHLAPLASHRAVHKFSRQPLALRPSLL